MKQKRHTPEEIIKKLREAEGLIAEGKEFDGACEPLASALRATSVGRVDMEA